MRLLFLCLSVKEDLFAWKFGCTHMLRWDFLDNKEITYNTCKEDSNDRKSQVEEDSISQHSCLNRSDFQDKISYHEDTK